MKFKIIDSTPDYINNPLASGCKIFNDYESFKETKIKVEDGLLNKSFFDNYTLILVVFYEGSVPKREILDIKVEEDKDLVIVVTNKSKITITSLDYRMHSFLIQIDKISINNCKYI